MMTLRAVWEGFIGGSGSGFGQAPYFTLAISSGRTHKRVARPGPTPPSRPALTRVWARLTPVATRGADGEDREAAAAWGGGTCGADRSRGVEDREEAAAWAGKTGRQARGARRDRGAAHQGGGAVSEGRDEEVVGGAGCGEELGGDVAGGELGGDVIVWVELARERSDG